MVKRTILFSLFLYLLIFNESFSRPNRPGQIPNGTVNGCINCHMSPSGGDARNAFGKLIEERFLTQPGFNGKVIWNALLASLDADNDGVSNGEELQDPYGLWQEGQPAPGNNSLVTKPGDVADNNSLTIDMQFVGMTPHVGQMLQLRVVDKSTLKEVYRTKISSVPGSDFQLQIENIVVGSSYWIDFFADHNANGIYDAPPADHAWRLELNEAAPASNDVLQFAHNTNFTDINWNYLLTLQFTGMNPHIGQLLEIRVEDDTDGLEVTRTRIESISQADFDVLLPGLQIGKEYKIEFYADLNKNGIYNAPPTDHAWEITFTNSAGDTTIQFEHNTTFTDINWKYHFTLNLTNMNPHIGQLFELRVVNQSDDSEVGRVSVNPISVANFSVSVPGIEADHDYRADYYADFNGNGSYNAPPTDHAWRDIFNSGSSGNVVVNFSHNTNFTDIDWLMPTDVDEEDNALPKDYALRQNYPNPFNPSTIISYQLPKDAFVSLKIYNSLGKEISVLENEYKNAGMYNLSFNAANLSSGIYYYRIKAGSFVQSRKMMVLK